MSKPKTITIDDVEYIRKDSIPERELPTGDHAPWVLGKEYFIQTVTLYFLGRLVMVTDKELVLEGASWVADTGRISEFMQGSNPNENEPLGDGVQIIGRGAVVSAAERKICLDLI